MKMRQSIQGVLITDSGIKIDPLLFCIDLKREYHYSESKIKVQLINNPAIHLYIK